MATVIDPEVMRTTTTNDDLLNKIIKSSEERITNVNAMVERLTAVIETNTKITMQIAKSYEELRMAENDKYRLMMDFLSEMRTTYSKHLDSLVKSRDDAVKALHTQQECVCKMLDKLTSGGSVVNMHGIGNTETH